MQIDSLQPLLYHVQSTITMESMQYALIITQAAELVKSGLPALQIIKEDTMAKKTKWDWLRPDYDLTDDYGDLFELEPDYAAIMAELAGCSMVAWEQGSNSIDDNGADTGDDCNVDAYCYN